MKLTRRAFIQASVATAGLLMAGMPLAQPVTSAMVVRKARPAGPAKGDWVASTCQGCTQWCAIQIFVEEGRAVRVRGNPLSKTNHGYVCPRGHLIPQQTYDPDRVKVPMKRTNPQKGRGIDPKFVPISWDEALEAVSSKLNEIRARGLLDEEGYPRVAASFGGGSMILMPLAARSSMASTAAVSALLPSPSAAPQANQRHDQ